MTSWLSPPTCRKRNFAVVRWERSLKSLRQRCSRDVDEKYHCAMTDLNFNESKSPQSIRRLGSRPRFELECSDNDGRAYAFAAKLLEDCIGTIRFRSGVVVDGPEVFWQRRLRQVCEARCVCGGVEVKESPVLLLKSGLSLRVRLTSQYSSRLWRDADKILNVSRQMRCTSPHNL